MSEKLGDAILELKVDSKKFDKGLQAAKANMLKFSLVAAGIGVSLAKAFDFAKLGAKIESQKTAFRNLAKAHGEDSNKLLANLKRVSQGTVRESQLIASANNALLLGLDPTRLDKLLLIARAASKATGDTVSKSFDDIVRGIGRASPLILDNLGIIVKLEAANRSYAQSIGKSASSLTDAEKKQAFFNAALKAGVKILKDVDLKAIDTSDSIAQLQTKFGNFTDKIKTEAAPAILDFFTGVEAIINTLKLPFDIVDIAIDKSIEGVKTLINKINELPENVFTIANEVQANSFVGKVNALREGRKMSLTSDEITKSKIAKIKEKGDFAGGNIGINFAEFADQGEKSFARLEVAMTGWASNFSSTMTDVLFGAQTTFGSILTSFAKMITQMLIQTQLIEPFLGALLGGGVNNAPTPGVIGPPSRAKGGGFFSALGFAEGGVVPGALGAPVPAIVHGGEEVLTPEQRRGGGGNTVVNVIGVPEGTRTEESSDGQGGKQIDVIIDETTADNVLRAGSKTSNALMKKFDGMRPSLIERG